MFEWGFGGGGDKIGVVERGKSERSEVMVSLKIKNNDIDLLEWNTTNS